MDPLKETSFPFRTGQNYPFCKLDFDYDFSKIRKVINLETYLFLAVDQQFNLHFIQYRDPHPNEKPIKPPSFALEGTGQIKFSLQYHTLKAFLYDVDEEDLKFSSYYYDRTISQQELPTNGRNWPDVSYLGEDRLLLKPSSGDPAVIMYYDHRLESEKITKIDWIRNGRHITPVDSHRVILYSKTSKMAVLTCTLTRKMKTLKFSDQTGIDDIKVLAKHGIAIATVAEENTIEILDLVTNKIQEKTILFDSSHIRIVVDEVDHSGKFVIWYINNKPGREKTALLTLWRTFPDRTVQTSEEIKLHYPPNPDIIEFLNKDNIVALDKTTSLGIYRLDEKGILNIYRTTVGLNPGYASEIRDPKPPALYSYSQLKMLDKHTFVAVKTRDADNSTDKQQVVVFNYAFNNATKKIERMTGKVLLEHAPDKVLGITHYKDKFIVFLTRSMKLYRYHLRTAELKQILVLRGIDRNESKFVCMEVYERDYVAIIFHRQAGTDRVLLIDMRDKICSVDSSDKGFFDEEITKSALYFGGAFVTFYSNRHPQLNFGALFYEEMLIQIMGTCPATLTNFIVTKDLVVIGSAPIVGNPRGSEKIIFYSLNEEKLLYEVNLDDLSQDKVVGNKMQQIISVNDHLVAFFFLNPSHQYYNNKIVLWDLDEQCAVAEYHTGGYLIKKILGVCKGHLLYKNNHGIRFLDLSPYLGKNIKKEKLKKIEKLDHIWNNFNPDLRCIDSLAPKLPVFVAYDKRMYPNSLLFFRKRNLKVECLSILDGEIAEAYNPYVLRQVMDFIFSPKEESESSYPFERTYY